MVPDIVPICVLLGKLLVVHAGTKHPELGVHFPRPVISFTICSIHSFILSSQYHFEIQNGRQLKFLIGNIPVCM
jgi:hypothetical protein